MLPALRLITDMSQVRMAAVVCLLFMTMTFKALAVSVQESEYGLTSAGTVVHQYTLINDTGMTVTVLDYGGIITQIKVPDKIGKPMNVVLALPDMHSYEDRQNFSSIIGRFANRISGGGFTLHGKFYALNANAQGITSHGGPNNFATKIWRATSFSDKKHCGVHLTYISPDGESGFPGELKTLVTFSLDNRNQFSITYEATTTKASVVNFTHHVFFNLDSWGSVDRELININANYYLPILPSKVVTGSIEPVLATPFDLRSSTSISAGLNSNHPQIIAGDGYDHNFVLSKPSAGKLSVAAQLESTQSGIRLTVSTTEPGIQFYTGNSFNGKLLDIAGRPILKNYGIALETQHYPDSPHHENFPSTVLHPGETFKSKTIYRFQQLKAG